LEFRQILEDANDGTMSLWLVCRDCIQKFNLNISQDHTIDVLLAWPYEYTSDINELPVSLKEKPLRQALFIQYVDELLGSIRRSKFGNRFPIYSSDLNETKKRYFLQELEQDFSIAKVFLPDLDNGKDRNSVALKSWVGAITAARLYDYTLCTLDYQLL
jgi:hypothetical protein